MLEKERQRQEREGQDKRQERETKRERQTEGQTLDLLPACTIIIRDILPFFSKISIACFITKAFIVLLNVNG